MAEIEKFGPKLEQKEQSVAVEKVDRNKVLKMSPSELVEFFTLLEKNDKLGDFLEKIKGDDALVAMISYWEKWLEKDHQKLVDKVVEEKKDMYDGPKMQDSLPLNLEKRFTEEELKLIFSHLVGIQLTFGCSKGCPFCGVDAVPGVREHIPYSQLANLFKKYGKQIAKTEPFLYWASEPSDYQAKVGLEDKTYQDSHQLAVEFAGYNPHITSKETADKKWLEFLNITSQNSVVRVSLYNLPQEEKEKRSQKIEEMSKGGKGIEIVGLEEEHVKGFGKSFSVISTEKEPDLFRKLRMVGEKGIGCANGVLITPRGIYNTAVIPISKEFPQGIITCPLEEISDIVIKPGDSLLDILRQVIIIRPHNAFNFREDSITKLTGQVFENNIDADVSYGTDKVRLDIDIKTKNNNYRIWFNEKGIVQKISRLKPKQESKKTVSYSEKTNFFDRLSAFHDQKDWLKMFKEVIATAIEENKFEVYTNWTSEELKRIINAIKSEHWSSSDYQNAFSGEAKTEMTYQYKLKIPDLGKIDIYLRFNKYEGLKIILI